MSEESLNEHRRRTQETLRELGVPATYALSARLQSHARQAALRHRRALSVVLMTCAAQIEEHADQMISS